MQMTRSFRLASPCPEKVRVCRWKSALIQPAVSTSWTSSARQATSSPSAKESSADARLHSIPRVA